MGKSVSKGTYIVIDGLPSSVKATVLQRLAAELQAQQQAVNLFIGQSHTDTVTGQALQRISKDTRYTKTALTSIFLDNATLSEELQTIQLLLEAGVTCLADHSYLTTLVRHYYSSSHSVSYEQLNEIVAATKALVPPSLLMIADVVASEDETNANANDRSQHERLRAGYLWEAKQRNLPIVYALADIDAVYAQVWQQVAATLQLPQRMPNAGMSSVASVLTAKIQPRNAPAAVEPPIVVSDKNNTVSAQLSTAHKSKPDSTVTVLEHASQLLRQKLGPLAQKISEEPRYEQKNSQGHYAYYIPDILRGKVRSQYIRTMNLLFDTYGQLLKELTTYLQSNLSSQKSRPKAAVDTEARQILRIVLPAAATSRIEVETAVTVNLTELASSSQPSTVKKLADELLPASHTTEVAPVTLADYSPRNELDIMPNIFYAYSDLPFKQLQSEVTELPYQRKLDVLQAYIQDSNGNKDALATIHYSFDIVCDQASFQDLQAHIASSDLAWQSVSPRLGYDMPAIIEAAGLNDAFEDCFDASLRLYSTLQSEGLLVEAQYGTLLGHKLRCNFNCSAQQLVVLQKTKLPANLLSQMYEKMAEVHPVLAETTMFKIRSKNK